MPAALVVTLLLVVLPTLGCQPASRDTATRATPAFESPTWEELDSRRVDVGYDDHIGWSPDGRFLYIVASTGLARLDTTVEYVAEEWSDLHHVIPDPDWKITTTPTVSPDGARITFRFRLPGDDADPLRGSGIRIVDAKTGADQQVLQGSDLGAPIAWHADGRGLLVENSEGMVSVSLVDDTRRLLVPRSERTYRPRVSPDGRYVAYAVDSDKPRQWNIHVAALDGSRRGPVVEAEGEQWLPMWTPDGKTLVYANRQQGQSRANYQLWGVEIDQGRVAGTPRPLLDIPENSLANAGASPGKVYWPIKIATDGTLVFLRHGQTADVYTVEIDPGTHELQGEPQSVFDGQGVNSAGVISPDGTLMAFFAMRRHPRQLPDVDHARLTPAIRDQSTGAVRLLDTSLELTDGGGFYWPPTWSPDSRYLLFPVGGEAVPGHTLYLFEVATGAQRWLFEDAAGETVGAFGWLPEGHSVVYGAATNIENPGEPVGDPGRGRERALLSVRQHDVDTGLEHELWRGPVGDFRPTASHLSPDGRFVTLPQYLGRGVFRYFDRYPPDAERRPPAPMALWILDLELGELRELARSPTAYNSLTEPYWLYNQWTLSGAEIIGSAIDNSAWRVNSRPRETTLWAIPVTGGKPRTLGSVFIEYGRGYLFDGLAGARFFSLHPDSNTLFFTDGGARFYDIMVASGFGKILEHWKEGSR